MVREISIELSQCARGKSGWRQFRGNSSSIRPSNGELCASLSKRTAHDKRHPDCAQVAEQALQVRPSRGISTSIGNKKQKGLPNCVQEYRPIPSVWVVPGRSRPGVVGRRSELVRRYLDSQARAVTVHKLEFSCIGSRAKWLRINSRNTRTFGDRLSRVGCTAWNSTGSGSQSGKTRIRRP